MKALTLRQPWASLVVAGLKGVENRTWAVPSTVAQWGRCGGCDERVAPGEWHGDMHIVETGPTTGTEAGHAPDCMGECEHCPVPVPVQLDPREPCGPVAPDGPFPFRLAIHAGKRHDGNEFRRALLSATLLTGEDEPDNTMQWIRGWWANRDGIGGYGTVIGTVLVTGCHHADECRDIVHTSECQTLAYHEHEPRWCSRWAEPNAYHWTLTDPIELTEPIPMRGRQKLWTVPDDAIPDHQKG